MLFAKKKVEKKVNLVGADEVDSYTIEKAKGHHPFLFHILHSLLAKLILQKMARPPLSSCRVCPI